MGEVSSGRRVVRHGRCSAGMAVKVAAKVAWHGQYGRAGGMQRGHGQVYRCVCSERMMKSRNIENDAPRRWPRRHIATCANSGKIR